MPKGVRNTPKPSIEVSVAKPELPEVETYDAYAPRHVPEPEPVGPKLIVMKLERNYRPASPFEVVGHLKPAVTRKNMAGVELVISPEQFIEGEPMPAAVAGTGFPHKLLAGTVIRIGEDEAKSMRKAGIGNVELLD